MRRIWNFPPNPPGRLEAISMVHLLCTSSEDAVVSMMGKALLQVAEVPKRGGRGR